MWDDIPVVLRVLLGLALLFVAFAVGVAPALFGPGIQPLTPSTFDLEQYGGQPATGGAP